MSYLETKQQHSKMSEHHAGSTSSSGEGQQPTAQQVETGSIGWQSEEAGLSPQLDKAQLLSDRNKLVA